MDDDLTGLGTLHRIAQRYGDGLKPELAARLDRRPPVGRNVIALPLRRGPAGPAHQLATDAELADAGIPRPDFRAARDGGVTDAPARRS
ncbi:hypothetical protein [Psychromarinibacter sp. S121]|uniref:hypothetical protein n=1 Tax=Psychromarinibacter sp. S121 TaxID=3415127 RepID=UPI003C79F699